MIFTVDLLPVFTLIIWLINILFSVLSSRTVPQQVLVIWIQEVPADDSGSDEEDENLKRAGFWREFGGVSDPRLVCEITARFSAVNWALGASCSCLLHVDLKRTRSFEAGLIRTRDEPKFVSDSEHLRNCPEETSSTLPTPIRTGNSEISPEIKQNRSSDRPIWRIIMSRKVRFMSEPSAVWMCTWCRGRHVGPTSIDTKITQIHAKKRTFTDVSSPIKLTVSYKSTSFDCSHVEKDKTLHYRFYVQFRTPSWCLPSTATVKEEAARRPLRMSRAQGTAPPS